MLKPLLFIGILTNLIYFPPDIIHLALIHIPSPYLFNIKIPFSSFPVPQNCGTLFCSILEYLHPFPLLKHFFNQFYLNSTFSSLVTVHFKLSPCHHLSLIHVSCILLFTPCHHFPTNLCISQTIFAIDFISHVFKKKFKKRKKSLVFSSEFFKIIIFFICLTQVEVMNIQK